jgi:hypothetical protein
MRPGKCPYCDSWLGAVPTQFEDSLQEAAHKPTEYELFISRQLGALITSAPGATNKFNARVPKKIISELVNRCFDGSIRAFTRYLGLNRSADSPLNSRSTHRTIGLSLLLKLAFVFQTPLLDLLTNKQALLNFSPKTRPKQRWLSIAADKERVLAGLVAAGHEMPPPSLAEVAARLGRGASILRQHSPETCKLITKNFLKSDRGRKTLTWRRRRLRSTSDIKAALNTALKKNAPPTLDQVAKSLGYKNRFALKYRVPDLYRALLERHQKSHIARRCLVESELEKSLQSNPPEELLAVAKRLGYVSTHELGLRYKELSKKIRSRFKDYEKSQFMEHARLKLASILSEMPPPSLKDTLQRLGRSEGWIRSHFPEERRSIVARYLAHRREQSLASQTRDKERIRTIVREFHTSGTFPSMNAVLDIFTASALKRTEVWATIKQARESLV